MLRTIPTFFRDAVEAVGEKTWLLADGDELTYAGALARIERAAAGLRAAGVGHQDRVLVTARNRGDFLLTWLAVMEVGAVEVPIDPRSSATELAGFVAQATPTLIVTDAELVAVARHAVDETRSAARIVDVADLFATDADGRGPATIDPDDLAVMIPTSGTTGRSKLVMQTHRSYAMAGEGFPYWMELTGDDRLMTSLPLFHVNALAYSVM